MIRLTATIDSPITDGRLTKAVEDGLEDGLREVGRTGERLVHQFLGRSLRHPTGRYESGIVLENLADLRWRITDSGSVYGPWLEGTSRRNARSRFKGYATFRRTGQELQREADEVAERSLDAAVGRVT